MELMINEEERAGLVARYLRTRELGREVTHAICDTLDRDTIQQAGEELGLLRRGVLVFDTEDVTSVLMDYAIQHVRQGGRNAIERYLSEHPPTDPEVAKWLDEGLATRYAIFRVASVVRDFGVVVSDLTRGVTLTLIDIQFSRTCEPGVTFAGHVHPLEECWVTTGASLPTSPEVLKKLKSHIKTFKTAIRPGGPQAREMEADFAARVIRWCLADGAAFRISYRDAS